MLYSHPVDDSEDVRERIKRATTTGTSEVEGKVTVDLLPSTSEARMEFRLRGEVHSRDAVAQQRSVFVRTNVYSQVDARKSVFFGQEGLRQQPATASCPTDIQIQSVRTGRRWLQRMATRRSHRELGEVQAIVARKTSRRFSDRLDERIGSAMEAFEDRVRQQLKVVNAEFEFLPPEVSFASTDRHLQVWIRPQPNNGFTAPTRTEYLDPAQDIHVVLHEQVVADYAKLRFAGRRIHDEEVLQTVDALRGNAPWSLWVHERRPRWSIRVADSEPIRVRFAGGEIQAELHLAEFQYGSKTLAGPIQVAVTVRPEITEEGVALRRLTGPKISINENGASQPSAADERLVGLLRQKFEGIFPPESYFDRMQAPAGGSWDQVRSLALTRLLVDDEWLEVSYQFETESDAAPGADVAVK